ncbi:hypothetical protein MWU59_10515 [Flavobacteriaceae bacterium F08102]|nr:hypothetical protein [Flavobacteriaceae bacterium F08102]
MFDLQAQFENAKRKATLLMKKGQINDYFNALLEMNHYKKLLKASAHN